MLFDRLLSIRESYLFKHQSSWSLFSFPSILTFFIIDLHRTLHSEVSFPPAKNNCVLSFFGTQILSGVNLWVTIWISRMKYRARAGANARRRRNKKAQDFTDFLTQKSTPLSRIVPSFKDSPRKPLGRRPIETYDWTIGTYAYDRTIEKVNVTRRKTLKINHNMSRTRGCSVDVIRLPVSSLSLRLLLFLGNLICDEI